MTFLFNGPTVRSTKFLALGLALLSAHGAAAQDQMSCVKTAIELRSDSMAAFQGAMTALVAAQDPQLEAIAKDAEAVQLTMHTASVRRILFALETDPTILAAKPSMNEVMNLNLDDAQLEALRSADPGYADLEAVRDAAIAKTQGAPEMDRLREVVRASVAPTQGFRDATRSLTEANVEADNMLRDCLN